MKGALFRHKKIYTGFCSLGTKPGFSVPKDIKALKNPNALAMSVYLYECAYLCLKMHIML